MSSTSGVQGIKKAEFCADFKNVQKSRVWQKGKNCLSAQNSASFDTLCVQFQRNLFSTLIRDGAVFLEDKRSNKIETIQYKKHFFKTSLRISRPDQNHMKQSDLGKSLDPTV